MQLTSYFTGYSEIYGFREELKAQMGEAFNLRDFHNEFLSYGSAPVPVIRAAMLADLSAELSVEPNEPNLATDPVSSEVIEAESE